MGGSFIAPKPDPGTDATAPWDFATFLQKSPDLKVVAQGIQGTSDTFEPGRLPPPSRQGIPGARGGGAAKTNDPKLDEPAFAGLGLWSMQFATTVINILIGTMKPGALEGPLGGESIATTLAYREEALHQALVEEGLISPETLGGTSVFEGIGKGVEGEGSAEGSVDVNDTSSNAAFFAWFEMLSTAMSGKLPPFSPETQALLNDIHSTDIETIKKALIGMADLSSIDLSHSQRDLLLSKLEVLTVDIAEANEGGGAFVLNMTVPGIMLPVFMEALDMGTDTTMSADDKNKLSQALLNICNNLGTANFEKATSLKIPSQEYSSLVSGDPAAVGMLLFTLSSAMPLPPGVTNADLIGALNAITSSVCSLRPEDQETLQSVDRQALSALFTQGLDAAEASGAITSDVKAKLLVTLVPLLAAQTSEINYVKLTGDLSSKDPAAIEKSLTFLTGVHSDTTMNTPTRRVVMNYIQALIGALVYMSNLRSLMLQMETEFTQSLSTAKVAGIMNEVKIAEITYTAALQKLATSYEGNIEAIDKKKLWAWLGPLISVLITLVMTIIIVALAVATVVTGGACLPAFLAAIGATAMIVSMLVSATITVVILVIVLIDASCQWAKGKSMWTMMCAAFGVTNELEIAAISAAFEIILQLVAIVCTLGVYSVVTATAGVVKQITEILTRVLIKELVKIILIQVVFMSLASSGLLTAAFKALGKVCFPHDEQKAALFATIMTVVVMILVIVMGSCIGGGGKSAAKVADKEAKAIAVDVAKEAAKEAAKAAGVAAGGVAGGAAGAAASIGESVKATSKLSTMMKEFGSYLGKLKEGLLDEFKGFFSSLKKVPGAYVTREASREITVQTAKELAEETAKLSTAIATEGAAAVGEVGRGVGATVAFSPKNVIKAILKGIRNFALNVLDHYKELILGAKDDAKMERVAKVLVLATELVKVALFALQLSTAVIKLQEARKEKYLHELLASLAENQAVLQSMSQYFGRLGSIDQTETIEKIMQASQEGLDNWIKLIQLVSDFIKDAGMRVSEMSSRAAAR